MPFRKKSELGDEPHSMHLAWARALDPVMFLESARKRDFK
jgi:hypothetical protein